VTLLLINFKVTISQINNSFFKFLLQLEKKWGKIGS
jgi:hypothetical protein